MSHPSLLSTRQRAKGFTLVEILIAVVVLALLLSLALPSFKESIRKSRRSEAYAALSAVQLKQERWRANNHAYTTNLTGPWPTTNTVASTDGLGLANATSSNLYTIAIQSANGSSYEVTASAVTGTSQAQDGPCAQLGVKLTGGNITYGSAPTSSSLTYSANDRCWSH